MSVMCSTKAFGIERPEQAGAFQIGAHHAGDIGAAALPDRAEEIGNGDGQRLGIALGHVHLQRGAGRRRRSASNAADRTSNFMPFSRNMAQLFSCAYLQVY